MGASATQLKLTNMSVEKLMLFSQFLGKLCTTVLPFSANSL
uniref:Uncharacterized protein n=1 Tax=Arundo donax TaxID=35708 RepID=A0A0A8YZC2_ARUDO